MKSILAGSCYCLLAFGLRAAAPKCEPVDKQNGVTFQQCYREDASCEALSKDQRNSPSEEWRGCQWPATIIKAQRTEHGAHAFLTHVRLTPSIGDSQRMDITVTIEKPDHTLLKLEQKDVPVITERDVVEATIIRADADFTTPFDPVGIPTVDAVEKGGARTASHSYR